MNLFFLIIFSLLLLYALLLGVMAWGWRATPVMKTRRLDPFPVTVIICARNERHHIGLCLKTLAMQDYPKNSMELILVDDHSSDNTLDAAEAALEGSGITYRIIRNTERLGKKQSITRAMALAVNPLIALRDADTYPVSRNWLRTISDFYQYTQADFIIAPLRFCRQRGWIAALQATENTLLTMLTAGSAYYQQAFLCNGANLVFTKSVFRKTEGFSTHLNIESGDDVLFLEEVRKIPGATIAYLKSEEAVVETYPERKFGPLLRQRVRWASKFRYNKNRLNLGLALLAFVINASWIGCLLLALIDPLEIRYLLFILFKPAIDILLLFLAGGLSQPGLRLIYLPLVAVVYPAYAVAVSVLSIAGKPGWNK